ncbi:excinuclease ABC subunit UvrB [Candidatus Gracilibacteria bacterium]|nr:excinuclease ABC subunit UvrB [Candidatus Gracilibacteria bacterium]
MQKFELVSPFQPSGDQPKAIETLIKGIKSGKKDQVLLGVTGSGKTFSVANVIQEIQKPTLILSHNKTLAAQLFAEFKEFFPNNAVDYFVSYYDYYQPEAYMPTTDTYIEKDASINEEIAKFRHAATMHLLTRKDVIIIATVSCIYGLGSVESYEALAVTIKKGEQFQRDKLLRRLTDIQYSRSHMEFKQGMFHVLGDVVEIFPPGQDTVIRLEFFGDEVDAIVEADSFTGEVIKTMDEITVFPAKHDVTTTDKIKVAVEGIRSEMEAHVALLRKMGKMLEAERIKTRTEYDLEIMLETGYCTGIENYTRYLGQREPGSQPETLLDYFPDDYLLIVDESHITIPQIGGMHNGNFSRKQTLIDYGFRMPSAHDNRPLKFEEFEKHMPQTIYISATPSKYEMAKGGDNIVQQIVRPTGLIDPVVEVRPIKGQILDLSAEINKRIAVKERTLITTLTKRSAEDLTDYLTDAGFKVKYLHSEIETFERVEILRDLRLGKFDVLVGINLLREGLDLPEVSFIAILDADKQGFLRSTPALIQTIGRAARNVNGFVVMYADKMTDAMKGALGETDRRRAIQVQYNKDHGITPQTIIKAVRDLQMHDPKKGKKRKLDTKKIPPEELARLIKSLEVQMELAVQNLEFEKAAEMRDEIDEIRDQMKAGGKGKNAKPKYV